MGRASTLPVPSREESTCALDFYVQFAGIFVFCLVLYFPFSPSNLQLKIDTLWLRIGHIWSLFLPLFQTGKTQLIEHLAFINRDSQMLVVWWKEASQMCMGSFQADLPAVKENTWKHKHWITHFHWHPILEKEEINNEVLPFTLKYKEIWQFLTHLDCWWFSK